MRAVSLLVAPLAAPLFFASPADSAFLPACCVSEGSVEPEDAPPLFVGAKVRRPGELALETAAEERGPKEAPLADAVAIPDKDEALPRFIGPPPPIPVVADDDAAPRRDNDNPNTEPCCGPAEAEPEDPPPAFAGVDVRSPDERELVATAEAPVPDEVMTTHAPVPEEATIVNAIGIPLYPIEEERPGVSEPGFRPVTAVPAVPAPTAQGADIDGPPCCTAGEPEDPFEFVGPKAKNRHDRALEATVEVPVPVKAPRTVAIAIPVDEPPALPEPARVPVTLLLVLVTLLTIGLVRALRRRRGLIEDEAVPPMRPLPDGLARPGAAAAPRLEPEVVVARARAKARELEPA